MTDNYDTKKWYISNDQLNAFIYNTHDILPNEISCKILDNCYDENTLPYNGKWWNTDIAFEYGISGFMLIGDTDELKNLQITFDRNWGYNFNVKGTRITILDSNHDQIISGEMFLCDQYIIHNKIKYHVSDPSKLKIKILYPKYTYI